jgi:uncharacterized protein YjbJ (UPF0337 family)
MNWHQIKGQWKLFKGHAKQQWGKLTDDDLTRAEGDRDILIGQIQQRYGIAREEANAKSPTGRAVCKPAFGRHRTPNGSPRRARVSVHSSIATDESEICSLSKGTRAQVYSTGREDASQNKYCANIKIRLNKALLPMIMDIENRFAKDLLLM